MYFNLKNIFTFLLTYVNLTNIFKWVQATGSGIWFFYEITYFLELFFYAFLCHLVLTYRMFGTYPDGHMTSRNYFITHLYYSFKTVLLGNINFLTNNLPGLSDENRKKLMQIYLLNLKIIELVGLNK